MNLNGGLLEIEDTITITMRKWPFSHIILFRELVHQAVQYSVVQYSVVQYSVVQYKHGPVHHAQKQSQQKR